VGAAGVGGIRAPRDAQLVGVVVRVGVIRAPLGVQEAEESEKDMTRTAIRVRLEHVRRLRHHGEHTHVHTHVRICKSPAV